MTTHQSRSPARRPPSTGSALATDAPADDASATDTPAGDAPAGGAPAAGKAPLTVDTVEAVVREKLSIAFGGKRGVVEGAVPTIGFTTSFVVTHELKLSLGIGVGLAVLLLLVRIAQRSNPQFVLNSLLGIGIAALFAMRSGEAKDAFLPGILLNAGYAAGMLLSIVVRWPVVGLMIGSVTGDPSGWRSDPGITKLCTKLTWLLLLPCLIRVAVQLPLYYADWVGLLGTAKVVMGWPLQVAAFAAMLWLLMRGRTPVAPAEESDSQH